MRLVLLLAAGCSGTQDHKPDDPLPPEDTGTEEPACPTWYADADGDSFGDSQAPQEACTAPPGSVDNPDDCDDADPTRHPGASWPADADGDGFVGEDTVVACEPTWDTTQPGDCDDGDPAAWPGAEDAWYDGVDADCDGWSDYDQDLDGSDSAGFGGGDCDDLDPTVFPGAIEVLDWKDTDCDGTGDEESAAARATFAVSETDTYDAVGEWRFSGGDLDGDGAIDLVVPGHLDYAPSGFYSGQVAIFFGPLNGAHTLEEADAWIYATASDQAELGYDTQVVEDTDGDGLPELWIASPSSYYYDDSSLVCRFQTPSGEVAWEDALGCTEDRSTWGTHRLESVRDGDGDGLAEVWLLNDDAYLLTEPVTGTEPLDGVFTAKILGYPDTVEGGFDFDADGVDDVVIGRTLEGDDSADVYLGPHSGVIAAQNADVEILADGDRGIGAALLSPGDHDGDGIDDLFVADVDWGNPWDDGMVWLALGGLSTGVLDLQASAGAEITSDSYEEFGTSLASDDFDRDGVLDLAVGAPGDFGGDVYVFLGPVTGSLYASSADIRFTSLTLHEELGTTLGAYGDLDGDSLPDLVAGLDGSVLEDVMGTIFVLPGL